MSWIEQKGKVIAVDFDGTIVEHKFPEIGDEMMFAFATLKALELKGHRLILWTYREHKQLEEAVAFCARNDFHFYAVNENYPGESETGDFSRKVNADIFIDDRNVGGFLGWDIVWQTLHPEGREYAHQLKNKMAHLNYKNIKRKGWYRF